MNHIENSYNVKLQRLVREMRADINATLVPVVKQYAPEYVQDSAPVLTRDGWADAIRNALDALLARWVTSPLAKAAASVIAGDFVRTSLQYTDRRIKRTTGIDVFASDRRLDEYIKAATNQNARLITSIPEQYLGQVANIVGGNMRTGMRPSYIEKALTQQFGVTQRRARLIARDQTSKVTGEMNKQRQINAGFSYFKWRDSSDSRVRERHHEIATAETPYGIGVYRWDDLPKSDKGEPIQPGSDYNCFPGASPVNVFYGAKKIFRHPYSGELTELVTESGERLVCTPNHPVLTDEGFVSAQSINIGDNVVNVSQQRFNVTESDTESLNVPFSKLFKAFELLGVSNKPVSSLGGEFHGDITVNEQIDVVAIDWELGFDDQSSVAKNFYQLFFTVSENVVVGVDTSCDGDLRTVLIGLTHAPYSIVSSACKLLAFLSRGFSHADEHRLTSIGLLYAALVEDAGDDVPRSAEMFRNCFDTRTSVEQRYDLFKRYILSVMRYTFGSGNIETPGADRFAKITTVAVEQLGDSGECIPLSHKLERVVDKRVVKFTGSHVYNLEMGEGLFVAHNLAVSNCRCVAIPVSEAKVKQWQERRK